MIKIINGRKIDVSRLDAERLQDPALKGSWWGWLTGLLFPWLESRTYERNVNNLQYESGLWGAYLVMFPGALLFYHYWPFKIMGLMAVGSALLAACGLICYANKIWLTPIMLGVLCAIGLHLKTNLSLSIIGWHFERYFFLALLAISLLALLRRAWNVFAWHVQDKALLRLYVDNKISLHQEPLPIDDYESAYKSINKALIALIDKLSHAKKETAEPIIHPHTIKEIEILLGNGTRDGLAQALTILKRETARVKK